MLSAALLVAFLTGDFVYLTDGTAVEGEVTRRGGRVIVRMRSGVVVSYPEEEVVKIVSSGSAVGDYGKRASGLADWDAGGWLDLGEWCLSRGMKKEARKCFEKASASATKHLPKAARKLAGLFEEAGELRRASDLYGMLETSFSDADARRRRAAVQEKLLDRFRGVLASARAALGRGNARKAIDLVGLSREAWPSQAEGEAMDFLAEARRAEEDRLGRLRAPLCGTCSGSGWMVCPGCNGKKTVKTYRQIFTINGIRRKLVTATCGRCKGKGEIRCTACQGTGYNVSAYTASDKRAVEELSRVCNTSAARPLHLGIPALHKRLAEIALRLPPGLEPDYLNSTPLRALAGAVPFERAPAGVASQWKKTPLKKKEQFLRAYALETVRLVKAFPPDVPIPGSAEELARTCEPADEKFLFTIEEEPRWVSLTTEIEAGRAALDSALARMWVLPSGLALYAWKEEGRLTCETLTRILRSKTAARRLRRYDYNLSGRTNDLVDQRVRVRGLFHRCPLSPPCARVEVWQVGVRPDEETERMLATGRKKVTFRFERTPLKDALGLLAAITGVSIRAELTEGAEMEVTLSARKEFLAVAVDRLAGATKVPWGFDAHGMVVGRAGDAERTGKILQLLGGE